MCHVKGVYAKSTSEGKRAAVDRLTRRLERIV